MRPRPSFALLVLSISFACAPTYAQSAWRPTDGDKLEFDVFRDGTEFGRHVVRFTENGEKLTVDTDVDLKVTFGPLTVFHYIHDIIEGYSAGRLVSIVARTKKDGRWKTLTVEAVESSFKVAGSAFNGVRAGSIIPSTHWNVAEMKQTAMLSTESGAMLPIEVIDQGLERVGTGAGEIEARRYLVKSDLDATFWYDASGRWVKCEFTAQGSHIEYVLRQLPS